MIAVLDENVYFLVFGRKPRLPVDVILGIPHVGTTATTEELSKTTQESYSLLLSWHAVICRNAHKNKLTRTQNCVPCLCLNPVS